MVNGYYFPRQYNITPSDTVDLPYPTHAIWVGTAGDVEVIPLYPLGGATAIVYAAVPAKSYLFGPFKRLKAGNTTATNIKGLGPS